MASPNPMSMMTNDVLMCALELVFKELMQLSKFKMNLDNSFGGHTY